MRGKWTEILCSFVGWDCDILNECSAASRKTLHRYAGAIVLLMLLWFYIGYGMASRYFKMDSVWSQLGVAAVFSFIVWIIERQIILIVGRNKAVGRVRIVLAVIMALLGATIIDQTLFGKDIDAQMAKVIEARTDERFAYRKRIIEDELARSRMELDSLETTAALLSDEIGKRPMIKTVLYTKSATGHLDSLGNAVMATGYIEEMVPNPKSQESADRRYSEPYDLARRQTAGYAGGDPERDESRHRPAYRIGNHVFRRSALFGLGQRLVLSRGFPVLFAHRDARGYGKDLFPALRLRGVGRTSAGEKTPSDLLLAGGEAPERIESARAKTTGLSDKFQTPLFYPYRYSGTFPNTQFSEG